MKDEVFLLEINKQTGKTNVFDYLVIVLAIIASATPLNSLYHTQTYLFFFAGALLYFLKQKIKTGFVIHKSKLVVLLGVLFLIFMTALVNLDADINYYLGLATAVFGCYFIVESLGYSKFSLIYTKLFVVITIYSILLTLLYRFAPSFLALTDVYLPEMKVPNWKTFYYIYNVWDLYARSNMVRNSACFREPGVWGSFVSIAIIMKISQMFKNEEKPSRKDYAELIILFVGAISSLSTSTIFCVALLYLLYLINSEHTRRKFLILFIVVFLFCVVCLLWGDILFDKLNANSYANSSLKERIIGFSDSFNMWLNNPIFGSGYTKYFENVLEGVNTLSYIFVLGEFGTFLFVTFIYMLWNWIRIQRISKTSNVIVFLVITIILNTQNLIFFPIIMLLMFYGTNRLKTK